jgi:UDP-N-acetylmuramate--alanine ligase
VTPVDQAEQLIQRGGHVHLMGIGGIGMAGVAWLLRERGLTVSGCDLLGNRQTEWLARNGISIAVGHHEEHIAEFTDWLVRSTAVPESHPEVRRARALDIPVSRRGDVLPALMRDRTCIAVGGTHGKTTTTAMIAQILDCGYCIGGEIAGVEGVARDGECMVVEADESDGTIAGYSPDYAVITNIEYDHMEHHASEAAFVGCFEKLIQQTKNRVYYRVDDPISRRLCDGNPKCKPFCLPLIPYPLSLPGRHNQWNAAAGMAVSKPWKSDDEIMEALRRIRPIRRRFETVYAGGGIRIISDYAHHPTEIAALIETAKALKPRRLLGVFQPHRYTRTLALGPAFPPSFDGLDKLWLVPVYAASEQPLPGGTSKDLLARFPDSWGDRLIGCETLQAAWTAIQTELQDGDLLLIIGAGDIEQLAERARALP